MAGTLWLQEAFQGFLNNSILLLALGVVYWVASCIYIVLYHFMVISYMTK